MTLDADHIIARRRLKRSLTFWRLFSVFILVLAVSVGLGFMDAGRGNVLGGKLTGSDHIARLVVEGIIYNDRARNEALARVSRNDHAKALIVYIDSPGGTVVGGEELYFGLREIAAKKPVVAVMGGTATSAGYMLAVGADHIVARSGTITGSIGVLMQTADVTGFLEKLGIKPEIIKSAPLKAQPNPFEQFSDNARKATREVVVDLFNMFVDMVAERRAMDRKKVLELADGRVFTGRQALENGLIDAIGGEEQARKWLEVTHKISNDLPVMDVEINNNARGWLKYIPAALGKALFYERLKLDGMISLWHPSL